MKQLKKLLVLWLVFGGIVFLILLVQSFEMLGSAEAKLKAWLWFVITFFPVTILLLYVKWRKRTVDINPFTFRLIYIISLLYLLSVLAILVLRPMISLYEPIDFMYRASYALVPIHLLLFGIMFVYLRQPGKPSIIKGILHKPAFELPADKPTVFISYSHSDAAVAERIKQKLEADGIYVLIDDQGLNAGANIKDFIVDAVKETDVTLSLVSEQSLLSDWVGMESRKTFELQQFDDQKTFIPVALDQRFFEMDFVNKCMLKLRDRIEQLQAQIDEREQISTTFSTIELNTEKDRCAELINQLPGIVNRLKTNLTVDISGDQFEPAMEKVATAVHHAFAQNDKTEE